MSRAFKYYALFILIFVGIFPAIFLVKPSYEPQKTTLPAFYNGERIYFESHDGLELSARILRSEEKPFLVVLTDLRDVLDVNNENLTFELALKDSLLKHYSLVFPDYRGFGKSERFKNPYNYNMNHMVYDLEDLRKQLKTDKITLLGHGLGTLISQYYAHQFSENTERLILVSPVVNFDRSAKQSAARLAESYRKDSDTEAQNIPYFDMLGYADDDDIGFFGIATIMSHMDMNNHWWFDPSKKMTREILLKTNIYSQEDLLYVHTQLLSIGLLYRAYKTPHDNLFQNLKMPVQMVFGSADDFSGQKQKLYIDSIAPEVQKISIDSAGYYPHLEQPEKFLQVLLDGEK